MKKTMIDYHKTMKDYLEDKKRIQQEAMDELYYSIRNLPTQYILDKLDSHDCTLTGEDGCECVPFLVELKRRQNKESIVH